MPSLCTISGILYHQSGDVAANLRVKVTPLSVTGILMSSYYRWIKTNASGEIKEEDGVNPWTEVQSTTIHIEGAVLGYEDGVTVLVPASLTANLIDLASAAAVPTTGLIVKDEGTALASLIGTFNFAGAGVVVTESPTGVALVTIPGGSGSGTVTSFSAGDLSPLFTTSEATATTTPALSFTAVSQNPNLVYAGPGSGGAAAPTFRSLVAGDIPSLSSVYQPLDADLTAIAALAGTSGLLQKTAANTWSLDTNTYATQAYADALVVGLLDDRGNYDASVNSFPASGGSGSAGAVLKGDIWTVSVAGTLGGTAVTAGDLVRALVDTPGQTAGNWAVSETNIGFTPLNASLLDGKIYVGNGSNIGTAVTPSGDVTMSNAGVTVIGATKVTNAMLAGSIDLTTKVGSLGTGLQQLRVNAGATALEYFTPAAGGVAWGAITGTLTDQSDLNTALGLKAPLASPSFTTPTLGVASATTVNKITITTPATGATLTIPDGVTLNAGAGGTLGSNAFTSTAFLPLAGGTLSGALTITPPAATAALISTTSNTGSDATSAWTLNHTLNTSGSPDVFALRVTDTARGAATKLLNIYGGASGTTSEFSIARDGDIRGGNGIVLLGGVQGGFTSGGNVGFDLLRSANYLSFATGATSPVFGIAWNATANATSAGDLYLTRGNVANLLLGKASNATPVANTFTIGESSRGGTDSNVAGANGTIQSGTGTGTGAVASLMFQTPTIGASGTTAQSYATRVSVDATSGLKTATAVPISIASGTNQRAGDCTLVGGTITVSNTTITSNTKVIISRKTSGGTLGAGGYAYTLSAGTSFTINSVDLSGVLSILDTSTISYVLVEVP